MLFNSLEFIFLFMPLALLIFFQLGRLQKRRLAIAFLVAASLFFYSWWNPAYLPLLIFSILFNYGVGLALSHQQNVSISKRMLLILGLAVNLALIGYFKYANFFVQTANDLLGTDFHLTKIILPLAISFFTFQQIAYLVDAYRGETKEYSFGRYCLFVSFFPQLIAGPIVHHKQVMPQFAQKYLYQFNKEDLAVGLTIFSLGLFKKVIFADSIAVYATPVFNVAAEGVPVKLLSAWGGALAYSLQLYFDFSGYSDMALGAARMFGIKLPLNFNSPYKATNIIDFWRRWHITLSHFLRDYLYIPLGGNRKGKLRRHLNLMITMLLGGLWHGAGWNFVLWGGLHGIYLIINHQWQARMRSLGKDLSQSHWWIRILAWLVTFIAIIVGWVFFRATDLSGAIVILKGMVGINGIAIPSAIADRLGPVKSLLANLGVTFPSRGGSQMVFTYLCSALLLAIAWFTPNTQQWMARFNPALDRTEPDSASLPHFWSKLQWRPTLPFAFIIGVLIFICWKTMLIARPSEFLYFNF